MTLSRRLIKSMALLAVAAAICALVGCSGGSGSASSASSNASAASASSNSTSSASVQLNDEMEELNVAVLGKDIKIAALIVADQEGFMEEEGLKLNYQTAAN